MTRNPFDEIEEMLEGMSRQFETGAGGRGSTPVDLRDEGDAFVVLADLPGYDGDDVELRLSGRHVEIDAERASESELEDGDYVRRERTRESVERSVRLPADVEEDAVTATLDDGVLTVWLPKRSGGEGKSIEISD
jgi:HSP20 family protein